MKAAVLEKIGAPLAIRDIEAPAPMHGQVLVKMLCAGICGSQLHEIDGTKGNSAHLPHLLGHEGCGIVEKVGYGVRAVSRGDKVVLHWRKGEGCEAAVAVYSDGIKSGPITTFSEYVVVSENRVTRIDDDVPNDFAALLGCALSTALSTLEKDACLKLGESVAVIGCGGIGLAFLLVAKLFGGVIGGIDTVAEKRAMVERIGVLFGSKMSYQVKCDVIIDTVGYGTNIENLSPSGRYILIGQGDGLPLEIESNLFSGEGQTVKATQGGRFNPTKDIPRYVNLWWSGALKDYQKVISHRMSLDRINEGIQLMRDAKAGRVMIEYE